MYSTHISLSGMCNNGVFCMDWKAKAVVFIIQDSERAHTENELLIINLGLMLLQSSLQFQLLHCSGGKEICKAIIPCWCFS